MLRTKQKAGRGKRDGKMSRQPPLPPGLPPRPSFENRYDDRPSGRDNGGDGYRPRYDENYHQGQDQHMQQPYQFRGEPDASSYRPSYDRARSPPRYDSYSSYAPGRSPPRGPANDTYRPRDPPQDFNFRYDAPPSIDFRQESYNSRGVPRQQNNREDGNGYRQSNSSTRGNARGGGYRGRGGPRKASDREFLRTNRAPTPELMQGMDDDQGNAIKFMPIEDVSDSDEAEMQMSEDENVGDVEQPMKKHARFETKAADGDSVPQWSNPDPYTVLPPLDESQRKKKDVVKLIRKARVTSSSENAAKTEAVTDDFISFDFGDEEEDNMLAPQPGSGVAGAPTGPKSIRQETGQGKPHISGSMNQSLPAKPQAMKQQENKGQPGYVSKQEHPLPAHTKSVNANVSQNIPPNKPAAYIDLTTDSDLGSRKRTHRDEIKGPLQGPPRALVDVSFGKKGRVDGTILKKWVAKPGVSRTPWLSIDHSDTANMGVWLHKEIMDFYHFVKPRDFEHVIRTKLVEEVRNEVKQNFAKDADIQTFGSFPAGLYLPTSDMDLVCVSDSYMRGGIPKYGSAKKLTAFDQFIKSRRLCLSGQTECIRKAKVPLVKYQDKVTGLKVDISFENDTGLIANKTFQEWKTTFPAMPILVTLIKHILAMRGLNEPVNGGIGGFSVTCLVTSLLQNMPQVQSGNMVPEHHLGEILMEFFDLYGNQFNWETTAIELNPPGYISKAHANIPYKAQTPVKFAIIDPNNRNNDIAGGSSNTVTILKCFSSCYSQLQQRMGELQTSTNRRNQSILECILGGDYSSFKMQRDHLAHVYETLVGDLTH